MLPDPDAEGECIIAPANEAMVLETSTCTSRATAHISSIFGPTRAEQAMGRFGRRHTRFGRVLKPRTLISRRPRE